MQLLTIVRVGGYGDYIFMSSVLPFLFEQHKNVHLEVNTKGLSIFMNDPRFDYVSVCDYSHLNNTEQFDLYISRWDRIKKDCKTNGKRFLNFWNSIENECILYEFNPDVKTLSVDEIAVKYNANYYEKTFEAAEVKMPAGWMHENTIYFDKEEIGLMERWHKRTENYFKLIVALGGSSRQKVFIWMQDFCKKLVDTYPQLAVYLVGGSELANDVWEYERTISYVNGTSPNDISYKQSMLMTKYADFVLGPETGMLTAAGMMGTPKTCLFTISGMDQMVKYHRNDFSVQSKSDCSPCHIMAYTGIICDREKRFNAFPKCIEEFDLDEIQGIIERQYCKRF